MRLGVTLALDARLLDARHSPLGLDGLGPLKSCHVRVQARASFDDGLLGFLLGLGRGLLDGLDVIEGLEMGRPQLLGERPEASDLGGDRLGGQSCRPLHACSLVAVGLLEHGPHPGKLIFEWAGVGRLGKGSDGARHRAVKLGLPCRPGRLLRL